MDDERHKKLEAGREKLAAYKKKKQTRRRQSPGSTSASQSDSSLSLSPPLLPENATKEEATVLSDCSIVSEHLNSNSDSVENDRSFQEIEISYLPSNFSSLVQNLASEDEAEHISQEVKPSLNSSVSSGNSLNVEQFGKMSVDVRNNVQSILDEILRSDQFKSDSEHTLQRSDVDSNENSFNIFKDVNLNDSLINDFEFKSNPRDDVIDKLVNTSANVSLNSNLNASLPNVEKSDLKVKQLEELLSTKDTAIAALAAELESLREITSSNQSTMSLNTSTTDYKLYQDEFQSKIVEFQNALSHRDSVIQQLTEALQQSIINREQLQEQSEYFSREILALQKQLAETSAIISQRKWDTSDADVKHDSMKSIKDSSNQTESLPSQILPTEVQMKNVASILETVASERDKSVHSERVAAPENLNERILEEGDETDGKVNVMPDESKRDIAVLELETHCSKLEETLNLSQINLMNNLKDCIDSYIKHKNSEYRNAHQKELKILEDKLKSEKMDHEAETAKLRDLLAGIKCDSTDIVDLREELEAKHAKEVEELRTYFEQKCAELEKHYSEEVFSQQSRKLSGSSTGSEASDFLFSSSRPRAGPGGDSSVIRIDISKIDPGKRNLSSLSKNDVVKLKSDLFSISKDLEKYNLDTISKEDFTVLKQELNRYDLRSLLKYDLSALKAEMQNEYHAELEILREDYDNRIDALNVEHDNRMQSMERKYVDKIESLKYDLDEALRSVDMNVSTAVQEVASSGEYELAEVVQSYERRLHEQVTLAKIDIINALEHQIQMLVANTVDDADWPTELLQIRNRFTEKYEKQIAELNAQHHEDIAKLKEEHLKLLSGALERARRKSLKESDSLNRTESDIVKERDNLKKTTSILRQLIDQLMKYFTECEDELNNTLVEELLKQGFDKNLTELEVDINLNESSNSTISDSTDSKKRVHFTPRFEELMATIDSSVPSSLDSNISVELKNELGACLKRLRSDANAILSLSASFSKSNTKKCEDENQAEEPTPDSLQDRIASLTRQLISENQIKKDLSHELEEARNFVRSLEAERLNLDSQVEQLVAKQKILESDLGKAREKISELIESGHKEIVSEGYGEHPKLGAPSLGERIATLTELQERARSMVAECASSADHPLLQLVDELCREGDRVTEEAKHDHEDLQQQIEAADKKLRATCHFLEEQAAEREQERDEAQREIASLHKQLQEREKDRVSCERINTEVEHLEQQMREMSKLIETNELKQNEVETEKKEAIEKIFVLRDIIRDLEAQVEARTETEAELRALVLQLEEIIKQQNKVNEELSQHLGSGRNISEAQQHIEQLEDEVQRLRLSTEFVGSEGALKQIKTQLNEFETNLDKRTRDLEALHSAISATSCSSPSEDMSIRDQIRPRSPSVLEECDLPLQQLARLKEKLIKHSRAEDAAVKRIRDLEMELDGIRHDLDEVQNERDLLQDQVSEQLVLISSLQMRLDDQRLRAEQMQKQTNTSLEVRIYDLENEVKSLLETINTRDKIIKNLNKTVEETKKRLEDQERELVEKQEEKVIADLQMEIQKLHAENVSLQTKINNDAQNAQVLPNLVDNIISDKNKDIEKLRDKLDQTQSELNTYLSLNLDHEQLKVLSRLPSSERAFSDILSLIDLDAPERMRKVEKTSESLCTSMSLPLYKRSENETTFTGSGVRFEPDISSIENVGQPNINYSVAAPLSKPNSTEIQKSAEKRVHFEDTIYNSTIEKLQAEILELKNELFARDVTVKEYNERLQILSDLEVNIQKLQEKLDVTENALEKATEAFEKEQSALKEAEKYLRIELAEKKMHLVDKENQLKMSEQDSARKDQMYINLAKEKRELEKTFSRLEKENEHYKESERVINENNKEIRELKTQLAGLESSVERIKGLESELHSKNEELKVLQEAFVKLQGEADSKSSSFNEFKEKLALYGNKIREKDDQNLKLEKDLKNMESQCSLFAREVEILKQAIEDKNKEIKVLKLTMQEEGKKSVSEFEANIKELKDLLLDRETEIEILNEDAHRYQDDISKLEDELKGSKRRRKSEEELTFAQNVREIAVKDLEIVKLTTDMEDRDREINHLQELVKEKDKIVDQMDKDSRSLRFNLEAIQNKIQESGNVIDLKRRLEDEQQLNVALQEEVNVLKSNKPIDMSASIEEITGAVRQQLDYSAHLDSNILSALGAGDNEDFVSLGDMNDIHVLKENLTKERKLFGELKRYKDNLLSELQKLEEKYELEQEKVRQLQVLIEGEKQNCNAIQLEDANMLEQLRIRLEGALENETEFEKLLEAEKRARLELELQVAALKQKAANLSSGENSKTELTEYKSLPNMDSQEVTILRKNTFLLQEENNQLKADIKNLKKVKSELDANLKYSKDMLQLKNKEIEKLELWMEGMKEVEATVKGKWMSCKTELEVKKQEVENSRILMNELEQEGRDMKKEIEKMNHNLKKAFEREAKLMEGIKEGQMKQPVPDKFLNKMKELGNLLKDHMKDNKHMAETVDKLTNERMILQERISELEEQNNIKVPFDDPVARMNHLFARYLRSESYRKALIWQKRYLIALLATYQTYPLFSKELPLSAQYVSPIANHPVHSSGRSRFKSVATAVVAVIRMQFLVQRWHSGKRGFVHLQHSRVSRATSHHPAPPRTLFPHSTTQFHVGQPVSSQNFSSQQILSPVRGNLDRFHSLDVTNNAVPIFPQTPNRPVPGSAQQGESAFVNNENWRIVSPNANDTVLSWSGATPPSKDRTSRSRSSGNIGYTNHVTLTNDVPYAPLQTPALLSQYLDRFDSIQQRLGLTIDKNST